MIWIPIRVGVMIRGTSLCSSSPRAYTLPCFTNPVALTTISGVMTLSMPRLSSSPQRPQLPRAPHLPLTVQGAGSFASLSSRGYVGACCCAWALPSSQSTPSTRLPTPTIRDVNERCIASSFQGATCREVRHAVPLSLAHAILDLCGGVVTQGNFCALTLPWHLWPVNTLAKGQDGAPSVASRWREMRACTDNACGESKSQNSHESLRSISRGL